MLLNQAIAAQQSLYSELQLQIEALQEKQREIRHTYSFWVALRARWKALLSYCRSFKAIDHTNLEFFRQLKKKGETDEKVYKIPAIGDTAKEVEIAIGWLEMMNKRVVPASRSLEDKQEAAKKCHDRLMLIRCFKVDPLVEGQNFDPQ